MKGRGCESLFAYVSNTLRPALSIWGRKGKLMKVVGLIDYYLDEWHANNYPKWIKEASGGELEVRYAYAKMDSPLPGGRTTRQWCQDAGIERIDSIQELIAKSDCINVLSPDNPEMHEELCDLPLRSGKPVYVDKTFAETKASAEKIFALAEESGTPCFSASALRFAQEYQDIPRQDIAGIVSIGAGLLSNYSIHQIEPIIYLMGPEVKRVMFIGTEALPAAVLEFQDGRRASFSHHGWDCPFAMTIDMKDGTTKRVDVVSDHFALFIKEMVAFFLGAPPAVSHEDTIAVIAAREAAIKASRQPGVWVEV